MSMPATRHRFTVEDWHQMIAAGLFRDDQRLELLEGEIFEMTPIGPPHTSVVNRLTRLWTARLGSRAIVQIQGPVLAGPISEPEPDFSLLQERSDFYRERHADPAEVLLVIEVADTSLAYDRAKLRIYAAAGMTEIWIVDLNSERIEIYRSPGPAGYTDERVLRRGDRASCLAFPDVTVTVDEMLG
jgi:Uma2 family endonuclease